MVRLAQKVARCTPIGLQRATNDPSDATPSATPVQHAGPAHRESGALHAQPAVQQARNKDATFDARFNPKKLHALQAQETELRELVAYVSADWPPEEQAEALAVALADPVEALVCFRALVPGGVQRPAAADDTQMRTCRQCQNLAPTGACRAAQRGDDFGPGIAFGRDYRPDPGQPIRCLAYAPGSGDPDPRSGRERWPWLGGAHAQNRS